jgi:RNA polymerase sigma factor (TIGR02999 family)
VVNESRCGPARIAAHSREPVAPSAIGIQFSKNFRDVESLAVISDAHQQTVTQLLQQLRAGDRRAFDAVLPLVYDELLELAKRQRRRWNGDDTLNTTALVHEAYLRLVDQSAPQWSSQPHFLAVASRAMRQILLDNAKRKHAAKRGGGLRPVPLEELEATLKSGGDVPSAGSEAIIALEESLRRLEEHDPELERIVECRFFGGMTVEDTAEALAVSPATVKRRWSVAQAWLHRDLKRLRDVADE